MQLEAIQHAREVRNRLRNPANTKPDLPVEAKPKPAPVVAIPADLQIAALRGEIRSAQIEIDDLRKKVIDLFGDMTEMKLLFGKHFKPSEVIKKIQTLVAERYGISRGNLLSMYRGESYVTPRHVAIYLAKSVTSLSLPVIGRHFGGRDHTTILHAVRKIEELRKSDPLLDATITQLAAKVDGNQ